MSSYIVMEREEVIDLAEALLDRIEKGREDKKKSLIQKTIDNREWWRRWCFWLGPLDEQQAQKKLEHSDIFSDWWLAGCLYCGSESTAEDLKKLAENAVDGLVNVSAEDLNTIK